MEFCQSLMHDIADIGDEVDALRELAIRLEREAHGSDRDAYAQCAETMRQSGVFDLLPTVIQRALCTRAFHQSHHLRDGISTYTSVRMDDLSAREVSRAMLEMPWSLWWRHSRVSRRQPDSSPEPALVSFDFRPVYFLPVKVNIRLDSPVEQTETSGPFTRQKLLIESRFSGHFDGPARFEIIDLPDGCVLRAAWLRVQPRGLVRLLTRSRMAANHMASECGEMPFAQGSGYLGLMRHLRSQSQ